MKFRNIYNRKDFVQINELFGGKEGGAGTSDGFANNAKLKDTLLGGLINGIFRSISWLWRKSKENFIINKLIAKLTNELLRGVILYCFANDINLTSGQKSVAGSKSNRECRNSKIGFDGKAYIGQGPDEDRIRGMVRTMVVIGQGIGNNMVSNTG